MAIRCETSCLLFFIELVCVINFFYYLDIIRIRKLLHIKQVKSFIELSWLIQKKSLTLLYKISNNNIRGLKIMEIEKIELQGNEFRLFYVTIHNEQYVIAEEKLENYIQKMIEQERYHEVENIDTMYAIYIPQEVADTENEVEIIKSAIDVLD